MPKRRNHTPERLAKYERLVHRLRGRIFDYPPEKEEKASRVLHRAIHIKVSLYPPPPRDQWGATAEDRAIMRKHGNLWSD